jgi:hypothetical protein
VFGNAIEETTTTTGQNPLDLTAVSGRVRFSQKFPANVRFGYGIKDQATDAFIECGMGYLNGSGQLVRERIENTLVAGTFDETTPAAVSLSAGTKVVICTGTAASMMATAAGAHAISGGFRGYGDSISLIQGGSGNLALVASRAYATPFIAQSANEIDALVVRVTVAGSAGALIRGAIYSVGADGLPDVQLALSGTADAATTGQRFLSFTAFRPPARFFGCLIATNGPAVYSTAGGINSNPLGFNASQEASGYLFLAGSGTTFPSSWSGASADVLGGAKPFLGVRCI